MKVNVVRFILVLLFLSPYTFVGADQGTILESLINEALANNPKVQAAYYQWQSAEHGVKWQAGMPDPAVNIGYFGESIETKVGPQEARYGASQTIPFPGKLSLRGKSQEKKAAIKKEQYEAVKREVIKEVKYAYYDLYYIDQAKQITEQEKNILENLEAVARRKYETNLVPQHDVIKAQTEISQLIKKLYLLDQSRKSLVAKMNSILVRSGNENIAGINQFVLEEFGYQMEQLLAMAREAKQELSAARLAVERAEYEQSLAKYNFMPDITLGVDYFQIGNGHTSLPDDGQDAWMGKVAFNIPLWFDKLGSRLKEKQMLLEAKRKEYEDYETQIEYEINDLYFKIITYKDIISLYSTVLIPQAEQAFAAVQTGYETGGVSFLDWLDAERMLLLTRLAYHKTVSDYQKSIAYLERVVGRDL